MIFKLSLYFCIEMNKWIWILLLTACSRTEEQSCSDELILPHSEAVDTSAIDTTFQKQMDEMQIPIIRDQILFDGDSIPFPNDLKINQNYRFKNPSKASELAAKRISKTLVEFTYQYSFKGKKEKINGQASLNPNFYLNSELDQDDQTKELYGSNEYIYSKKGLQVFLRFEKQKSSTKGARAFVYLSQNNQILKQASSGTLRLN